MLLVAVTLSSSVHEMVREVVEVESADAENRPVNYENVTRARCSCPCNYMYNLIIC